MEAPQLDVLRVDIAPAEMLRGFVRHRRRFADSVSSLDDEALRHPTRCTEWSVADVLRHCTHVDEWFRAGAADKPVVFLDPAFDAITTPDELVADDRRTGSDAEARDRFVASSYAVATETEESGSDCWGGRGASPIQSLFEPFGVSIPTVPWWLAVFHHFLDSSVHERDVLIPLGIIPPEHADETVPVLTYILGVSGIAAFGPIDATVGGIKVTCEDGPVMATPVDPRADVASIIDALTGRGDLEGAVDGLDDETSGRLSRVGRFLGGALRNAARS